MPSGENNNLLVGRINWTIFLESSSKTLIGNCEDNIGTVHSKNLCFYFRLRLSVIGRLLIQPFTIFSNPTKFNSSDYYHSSD